jgi:hypothetical protein
MDAVIALVIFAVIGFAGAFSILPLQTRRERQDQQKTPEQEWQQSGFSNLSRSEFELCRILPTNRWTVAEFVFQDEQRREFGRYDGANRVRAGIHYQGGTAGLHILRTPFGATAFAEKVGGSPGATIVIRNDERLLAEVATKLTKQEANLELRWQQRDIVIQRPRWRVFNQRVMAEKGRQIGAFRRAPGLSRKILVAFQREVPEELRVWICCLALLQ